VLAAEVILELLAKEDKTQFIKDNQEAFKYGALEEFGVRDEHLEEDGEIISRETIEKSISEGTAFWIIVDGKKVGGLVIKVLGEEGCLDLLFVKPECHTKGIGYGAWCKIEKMYPYVKRWETCTPYFEQRNIHFYINKCGFHAVEYFNRYHQNPNEPDPDGRNPGTEDDMDGMFRFVKIMQ